MKTELKSLYRALTILLLVKVLLLPNNADFLKKNADISEVKRALVLKGIFSEIAYVCIFMYQI